MRHLAKIGSRQSYTYFTWKNSRVGAERVRRRARLLGEQEYFRPNFFANTPDILHAYLQHGGRAGVRGAPGARRRRCARAIGIYSGYENIENVAVREGSEEYLNSEKYELQDAVARRRTAADDRAGSTTPAAQNPALQELSNVSFLDDRERRPDRLRQATAGNIV